MLLAYGMVLESPHRISRRLPFDRLRDHRARGPARLLPACYRQADAGRRLPLKGGVICPSNGRTRSLPPIWLRLSKAKSRLEGGPVNTDQLSDSRWSMVSLVGKPTDLRPFVCEGSPLECEAFLVGINPASEMSCDFWDFWSDSYGFDKRRWFERYKVERRDRPLEPGRMRRNEISNTRRVIEWILEEAKPIRCLETNIYARATAPGVHLHDRSRSAEPFSYLLRHVAPSLVIAHGKPATEHLKEQSLQCELWCVDHFSRGWSKEEAQRLGVRIRKHLLG